MKYVYSCKNCDYQYEVEHSIAECDLPRYCGKCEQEVQRVLQPVRHVGPKVKPGSAEINAHREHWQQYALDKKRGFRK